MDYLGKYVLLLNRTDQGMKNVKGKWKLQNVKDMFLNNKHIMMILC
jgi:uncharacterized protein with GYD domain